MEGKILYNIRLDGLLVGTNGDLEFDTEAEAQADADDYIISELSKEYNRKVSDFEIQFFKATY